MSPARSNLNKFDHIVVLMLENHSLDSLAGYLYDASAPPQRFIGRGQPDYDGVAGKDLANSVTTDRGETITCKVQPAPFQTQEDMTNPFPDPGEVYKPHINTQLFRTADAPPSPTCPKMDGFVKDYYQMVQQSTGWDGKIAPTKEHLQKIMNAYPSTDNSLPVLSGLARAFAISDEWFCSVPSQTFCNRSFFNSGSSHGFVSNADGFGSYAKWLANTQKTVFNALTDAGKDWRVFYDTGDAAEILGLDVPFSLTRYLHLAPLLDHGDKFIGYQGTTNTAWSANSFLTACQDGTLPEYTFIEPRLLVNHNDMHPPFAPLPHIIHPGPTVQSSILAGEWLVWNVYNAVMNGAKWDRTLLVITFDEHGGCYDHVSPPWGMLPPDSHSRDGEDKFGFDRAGVRVPAIFISAYIEPQTVIRAPEGPYNAFDHTSMIKTVKNRWNLTTSLGARADSDQTADISAVLTRDQPRSQSDFPTLTPRPYVPLDQPAASACGMTGLQKDILGLIAAHTNKPLPALDTVADGLEFLRSCLK